MDILIEKENTFSRLDLKEPECEEPSLQKKVK